MMRRSKIDHLLRAAASVTGHRTFVLVGSTVVLVRCRNIPADMLLTPEIDLSVPDIPDQEDVSDRIEGGIGQGSPFHNLDELLRRLSFLAATCGIDVDR
ncbi:hypothetical protein [Methylobacterium sp. 17Sr1-1]|uniref:hypothetical protein n=1 Tax=Methylobacterium sp. 17Sr1-1 TaxID=2202826 RepID=UPI000D6F16E9|nr:hypothetical protein [Methylobacterium sp. 17Sr1-1]AWN51845.1 hypothetical protein DK412_09240 [Methylobacterium sp. 17Sr1-1]